MLRGCPPCTGKAMGQWNVRDLGGRGCKTPEEQTQANTNNGRGGGQESATERGVASRKTWRGIRVNNRGVGAGIKPK